MAGEDDQTIEDQELENGQEDDAEVEGLADDQDDAEGHERVEGDEAEDDDQEGSSGRVGAKSGREANRVRALRNESRQQAAENARLKRELDEVRQQQASRQREVDPEIERQRLELMTPEERMEYRFDKARHEDKLERAALQRQIWDGNDRANYQSLVASNPLASRHKDEVERLFREQMQKGAPIARDVLLKYVIGEHAFKSAPKARQAAASGGQRRIAQQTTRPGNGRGDVQGSRRGGQTPEDRLKDVTF